MTVHFDATNPEARKYIWGKCKSNYFDKGIRVFWLDEAEPEYTVYDFDSYRYWLGPNTQIGNLYPYEYARAFYEGQTTEGQKQVINLVSCAWAGSQRFGALVWSGEIHEGGNTLEVAAPINIIPLFVRNPDEATCLLMVFSVNNHIFSSHDYF